MAETAADTFRDYCAWGDAIIECMPEENLPAELPCAQAPAFGRDRPETEEPIGAIVADINEEGDISKEVKQARCWIL